MIYQAPHPFLEQTNKHGQGHPGSRGQHVGKFPCSEGNRVCKRIRICEYVCRWIRICENVCKWIHIGVYGKMQTLTDFLLWRAEIFKLLDLKEKFIPVKAETFEVCPEKAYKIRSLSSHFILPLQVRLIIPSVILSPAKSGILLKWNPLANLIYRLQNNNLCNVRIWLLLVHPWSSVCIYRRPHQLLGRSANRAPCSSNEGFAFYSQPGLTSLAWAMGAFNWVAVRAMHNWGAVRRKKNVII